MFVEGYGKFARDCPVRLYVDDAVSSGVVSVQDARKLPKSHFNRCDYYIQKGGVVFSHHSKW